MLQDYHTVQTDILDRFSQLQSKSRLAHAYLFVGPKLIGKSQTALAVAHLINDLISLESMHSMNAAIFERLRAPHPDITMLSKEYGEVIKIDDVRDVLSQAKLRPFSAEKKVFILCNVENFTLEAANALLKTLEEPSKNSILILTTSVPEKVLGTIKSRCHQVNFFGAGKDSIASDLSSYYDVGTLEAQFLAYFSEGCLGKASQLKGDEFFERKNALLNDFLFAPKIDQFVKQITGDKQAAKEFLDVLLAWVRDCLLLKANVTDERIIHSDRMTDLERFAKKYEFKELVKLHKEIVNAQKQLAENLNLKIPLLTIRELCNG